MPYYGKITGTNNGVEGTWLVELDDDGVPTPEFTLVPPEFMPDAVPVWAIHLKESSDPEQAFTRDEVRRIAFLKMRRSMARFKGRDAESQLLREQPTIFAAVDRQLGVDIAWDLANPKVLCTIDRLARPISGISEMIGQDVQMVATEVLDQAVLIPRDCPSLPRAN